MADISAGRSSDRGRLRFGVVLVAVLDLLAIFLGSWERTADVFSPGWSIGSLGVITFLGILMLENYIAKSQGTTRTEVRNAIASTFMIVYFALLGQVMFNSSSASDSEIAKSLVGNFTYLMGVVVIFYFGSKAVSEYVQSRTPPPNGGSGGDPTTTTPPEKRGLE